MGNGYSWPDSGSAEPETQEDPVIKSSRGLQEVLPFERLHQNPEGDTAVDFQESICILPFLGTEVTWEQHLSLPQFELLPPVQGREGPVGVRGLPGGQLAFSLLHHERNLLANKMPHRPHSVGPLVDSR